MQKAGIITFHCADNFGAVLQVYALMRTVREFGIDVEIIDFVPRELIFPYTQFVDLRYSLMTRGARVTARDVIRRTIKYSDIKSRIANFSSFRKEFLRLSSNTYYSEEDLSKYVPKYDFYITGSDQVWNPDFLSKIGTCYFLDFAAENSTKISYAASIAMQDADLQFEKYARYLSRLDYISVREKSARRVLSTLTNKPVHVTLDPTLLMDKEQWSNVAVNSFIGQKYILVYDLVKDPVTVAVANKVAKKYNCKIVSYSSHRGYKEWHSSFSSINPTGFVGLFRDAEFVVTSSFHGTAFAILFNKPFYTISHPTRGSRMIDLLGDLELDNRIVNKDEVAVSSDIDYANVNILLGRLREKSIMFLEDALRVKKR